MSIWPPITNSTHLLYTAQNHTDRMELQTFIYLLPASQVKTTHFFHLTPRIPSHNHNSNSASRFTSTHSPESVKLHMRESHRAWCTAVKNTDDKISKEAVENARCSSPVKHDSPSWCLSTCVADCVSNKKTAFGSVEATAHSEWTVKWVEYYFCHRCRKVGRNEVWNPDHSFSTNVAPFLLRHYESCISTAIFFLSGVGGQMQPGVDITITVTKLFPI